MMDACLFDALSATFSPALAFWSLKRGGGSTLPHPDWIRGVSKAAPSFFGWNVECVVRRSSSSLLYIHYTGKSLRILSLFCMSVEEHIDVNLISNCKKSCDHYLISRLLLNVFRNKYDMNIWLIWISNMYGLLNPKWPSNDFFFLMMFSIFYFFFVSAYFSIYFFRFCASCPALFVFSLSVDIVCESAVKHCRIFLSTDRILPLIFRENVFSYSYSR